MRIGSKQTVKLPFSITKKVPLKLANTKLYKQLTTQLGCELWSRVKEYITLLHRFLLSLSFALICFA